mgnify:CR=1 FL=1
MSFFEGDPKHNNGNPVNQAPGHQEIELALVKLISYNRRFTLSEDGSKVY